LTKIIAFKLFYHPTRYPIPFNITFLRLGETNFHPHFKMEKISGINLRCVKNVFSRFAAIKKMRMDICLKYCMILESYKEKISYFKDHDFSRFPVIFKSESERIQVSESLQNSGISANTLYPFALNTQPGLREILNDPFSYKGAEFLSKNLITLPVNEFIDDVVIGKVDNTFEKFLN
jgi:dTDP-4-amino-4,6-dideoxygalactose transaminase